MRISKFRTVSVFLFKVFTKLVLRLYSTTENRSWSQPQLVREGRSWPAECRAEMRGRAGTAPQHLGSMFPTTQPQARGHATKLHRSLSFKPARWKGKMEWLSSGVPCNSQSLWWWFGERRQGHSNIIPDSHVGLIIPEVHQPMWHSVCMGFGTVKSSKCVQQSYPQY